MALKKVDETPPSGQVWWSGGWSSSVARSPSPPSSLRNPHIAARKAVQASPTLG